MLYSQNTFVEALAQHCGDRWPEAMFMAPCLTSVEERERAFKAMRVLCISPESFYVLAKCSHTLGIMAPSCCPVTGMPIYRSPGPFGRK